MFTEFNTVATDYMSAISPQFIRPIKSSFTFHW